LVKKLSLSAYIGAAVIKEWDSGTALFTNSGGTSGNWLNDNSTGYAGVRFDLGSNTHYGWVELQITDADPGPPIVKILQIAYEDIPDKPINAGESAPAVPSISVVTVTASIDENSGNDLQYRFTASAAPSSDLTINFAITGGASLGDFTVTNGGTNSVSYDNSASNIGKVGTITIKSGETTADLLIVPVGDAIIEEDETVIVSVENP